MSRFRRFSPYGIFWRQFLRAAILVMPPWIEPSTVAFWALFFLLWGPGRRGVMQNLEVVLPGSSAVANFFRTYRVFWNYAWTIAENNRHRDLGTVPDWTFEGFEHFTTLDNARGAIVLTAHMGSYDLGAEIFSQLSTRRLIMVRAPERDPETRRFEEEIQTKANSRVEIGFNTSAEDLAFVVLSAVQEGGIVAIQGDRSTPGVSTVVATLFGKKIHIPAGPFALAMASGVAIHPLFVIRAGRRRYKLLTLPPFKVERQRNRAAALESAARTWCEALEPVVRKYWFQWFAFDPVFEEPAP